MADARRGSSSGSSRRAKRQRTENSATNSANENGGPAAPELEKSDASGSPNGPNGPNGPDGPDGPDGPESLDSPYSQGDQDSGDDESASPANVVESNRQELEERVNDLGEAWETESIFEDVVDDLIEDGIVLLSAANGDNKEVCTAEEAVRYRQELRAIGPGEFCKRTVDAGVITAKRLLTAFGVRPPSFLEGEPDEAYFGLLSLALSRELLKRAKLPNFNSVDDAVQLLQSSKNIVVLTGAGISTSLGIPDFRSKDTGLYSRLEHLGLSDPQEVFDIDVFRDDPSIFYSVARDILPATDRFTPTHAFIAMLQQRGKLLTNYSQNIDNLEAKAGVRPDKLIQCHGSFATATCFTCGYRVEGDTLFPTIKAGSIPYCPECSSKRAAAGAGRGRKRKAGRGGSSRRGSGSRSTSDEDDSESGRKGGNDSSCGVMKPDITFFGEPLPDAFSQRLTEHDRDRTDLVVVIGTSLKVAPVSEVVPFMPAHVPQIYISRTPVHHINFDIDLLGDCDVVVAELCRRLGWDLQHEMVPQDQRVQIDTPMGTNGSQHVFTDVTDREKDEGDEDMETLNGDKEATGKKQAIPARLKEEDHQENGARAAAANKERTHSSTGTVSTVEV